MLQKKSYKIILLTCLTSFNHFMVKICGFNLFLKGNKVFSMSQSVKFSLTMVVKVMITEVLFLC